MNSAKSISRSRASSGTGVDVAGDGGQRVVDEVRRDLCPERAQLGLRQPLLLGGHQRQLDLGGHEAGRFLDDPQLVVARATDRPVEHDQRADPLVLGDQRSEHGRPQRAAGVRGHEPRDDVQAVVAGPVEQPRQQISRPHLFAPLALDREHGPSVGQSDRGRAGERPEVRHGPLGGAAVKAPAQVRKRGGGGVEGGLHRVLRASRRTGTTHGPPHRCERCGDPDAQYYAQSRIHGEPPTGYRRL